MITVGIRDLKQRTSELVRRVREENIEVEITYHGEAVAMLIPLARKKRQPKGDRAWLALDRLAMEINSRWQGGGAVEAVSEGRRNL